jgi:hypothetical protein
MGVTSAHYHTGFQALNTQIHAFWRKDLLLEGVSMQADVTVMQKEQLYLLVERLMDCRIYPNPYSLKYCLAFALLSAGLACSLLSPDASIFAFANSF